MSKYVGEWIKEGKYRGRFVRDEGSEYVELPSGVKLPITFLEEVLEGQWEADTLERARRVAGYTP